MSSSPFLCEIGAATTRRPAETCQHVWRLGECSLVEVHASPPPSQDCARIGEHLGRQIPECRKRNSGSGRLLRCRIPDCLREATAQIEHQDRKQLGEGKVLSAQAGTHLTVLQRNGGRNLEAGLVRSHGGVPLTLMCSGTCSVYFLLGSTTLAPGVALPTVGWSCPHLSPGHKMPYRLVYRPPMVAFSQPRFLLPR